MEKLIEAAKKVAEQVEAFSTEASTADIEFRFDKLYSAEEKHINGIGLRVIKDGKIGFASATITGSPDGGNDIPMSILDNAIASAKFGQEAKFELPAKPAKKKVKVANKDIEKFQTRSAIDVGNSAIAKIKEKSPDTKCEAGFSKSVSKIRVMNSAGLDESYKKTIFSYGLDGIQIIDESFIYAGEYDMGCELKLETDEFVRKILRKLELAKKLAKVTSGKMRVIFMPEAITSLLYGIMVGINGKTIQKKSSPLCNRIGEKLFDEKLTIVDDGTLDLYAGSSPFDEEGVATRRTPIFEKGILKNFIFDLQTASAMQTSSTGNGRRGFNSLPTPGISNWIIETGSSDTGNLTVDDMVKDIKEGLIVHQVIGGGQSNLLAGDFSVNVGLGYKIENGEIVGRVKDTMVAGNVYESFNHIVGLGKEAKALGAIVTPAFYMEEMNVVSK